MFVIIRGEFVQSVAVGGRVERNVLHRPDRVKRRVGRNRLHNRNATKTYYCVKRRSYLSLLHADNDG